MRKIIKAMMTIITVLIVSAIGLGVYTYSYIKGYVFDTAYESAPPITVSGNEYNLDSAVVNILILGVDYDESRLGKGLRSDTMMLLSVNTVDKTATLLSIPRDTRTTVNKLDSNGMITSSLTTKINAAFAYGGGSSESTSTFGNRAKNAIDAAESLINDDGKYNVQISYYLVLDMDAIAPCVDAIGGVDITLEDSMPNIGNKGETVHLSGSNAELYVRTRKGAGLDGSDTSRAERQRGFVKAYLQKLKTSNLVSTIPSLYNELSQYIYTNMDLDKIAALGLVLKDSDLANLNIDVLPGKPQYISGVSYYIADRDKLDDLIANLFYSEN